MVDTTAGAIGDQGFAMMSAEVFAIVNLASSIYHVRPWPEDGPKRRSTSRPESLGLMLFTIEILKARLTASGLSRFTLAFTSCRRMPCIASRSATPNASAMSCSPSSGSGWSMAYPCNKSFIRGAAATVV